MEGCRTQSCVGRVCVAGLGWCSYAAPEVLDGSTYGVSVDNWSAGVISYSTSSQR